MKYTLFLANWIGTGRGHEKREVVVRTASEIEIEAERAGAYAYLWQIEGGHETTINLPGTGWVCLPWVADKEATKC